MGNYLNVVHNVATRILYKKFKGVFHEISLHENSKKLNLAFTKYIEQIPTLNFNGGRYDINATKPFFIRQFVLGKDAFVIKKGNNFLAISTPKFLFLDIINFLAPGFSYSNYLKAYNIKENKAHFPYEYIGMRAIIP